MPWNVIDLRRIIFILTPFSNLPLSELKWKTIPRHLKSNSKCSAPYPICERPIPTETCLLVEFAFQRKGRRGRSPFSYVNIFVNDSAFRQVHKSRVSGWKYRSFEMTILVCKINSALMHYRTLTSCPPAETRSASLGRRATSSTGLPWSSVMKALPSPFLFWFSWVNLALKFMLVTRVSQ